MTKLSRTSHNLSVQKHPVILGKKNNYSTNLFKKKGLVGSIF